ncbi:MAG: CRISPR-associated primase-polymerase type A1 [candidate division KSB1 bacterium]|nr:CRISPR-associated primase-polymerase type A1 [candidate division KSB1 bacterium]
MFLFNQLTELDTLSAAWEKVLLSGGAPGSDNVSVDEFEENASEQLEELAAELHSGAYQPLPLKTFTVRKEDGGERVLHIPAVRDRIVQQAVVLVLQPIYEKIFHNCSYAYRPGRSALKAVERVERHLKKGRHWVLNLDIEDFFDMINRQILLQEMGRTIDDDRLLKLIHVILQNYEKPDGRGIAQGTCCSPLFSNIYLHPLDDALCRASWQYIRYSDNLLVLDYTEELVREAFQKIEAELQALELAYHPDKTEIVHLKDGFSFLGFHFDLNGRRPDKASYNRLEQSVSSLLGKFLALNRHQWEEKLDALVRGWLNYYRLDRQTNFAQLAAQIDRIPEEGDELKKTLVKAALALQAEGEAKARSLLQTAVDLPCSDTETLVRFATLCERVGLDAVARDALTTAYRLDPSSGEAAFALGLFYLREGRRDAALRWLQKAVQNAPEKGDYHFALGAALQDFSLFGAADKLFVRAVELNPELKSLLEPPHKEEAPPVFTQEHVQRFREMFQGREGIHAVQWLGADGRSGYMPVKRPIEAEDIARHFAGQTTLAMYLVRMDQTVRHLVFDIDLVKSAQEFLERPEERDLWRRRAWSETRKLQQLLQTLGLPAYAEDSGYKGYHLWIFIKEPTPAEQVVKLAKKILACNRAAPEVHIEYFPAQSRVSADACGPLIKLPLGLHLLTRRRCVWVGADGLPVPDPMAELLNIRTVSAEQIRAALRRLAEPKLPVASPLPPEEQKRVEAVMNGCRVLHWLAEKAERQQHLTHLERLTLLGVLGHLGEAGRQKLHEIIGHTLNYDARITEKWFRRPHRLPLSCPKIRLRHQEVTPRLGCNCRLPEKAGGYPSPLLYADAEAVVRLKKELQAGVKPEQAPAERVKAEPPQAQAVEAASVPSASLDRLVGLFLACSRKKRRLEQQLAELEKELDRLAAQCGCDRFDTLYGRLQRVKINGELKWILEI